MNVLHQMKATLTHKVEEGSMRTLKIYENLIDFTSNDYLGLSRSVPLMERIENEYRENTFERMGATGSRLLSGNNKYVENLEKYLSDFWGEEALLFNSGYDANIGLFSSVPQREDTIILDEFIHACIIDGARLSKAKRERFIHNDMSSLEEKLKRATGNIFVGVESLYSMDGDFAPLLEISTLCQKYGANLIVDEAHSTAIYGTEGRGIVHQLNLQNKVFARIFTFGKALGVHGAVVVGSLTIKEYLINFARTFIYTTALPLHSLISIKSSWQFLRENPSLSCTLHKKIKLFQNHAEGFMKCTETAIQAFKIPGNFEARNFANKLVQKGFDVRPILYPSVSKGLERIRLCIHSFNLEDDIIKLTVIMNSMVKNQAIQS